MFEVDFHISQYSVWFGAGCFVAGGKHPGEGVDAGVVLVFEATFSEGRGDIGGACKGCLVFFQERPDGIGGCGACVDPSDLLDDGAPTVATIVQAVQRGGTEGLGVIHGVNNDWALQTAATANNAVFGSYCVEVGAHLVLFFVATLNQKKQ